jgi:putative ABC transport system permease protein
MDLIIKDIRYGVRSLLKQPGFTSIAIITLALGIGANTAIFSVVNAVLLRSLSYPHAEQMVYVLEGRVSDPKFEGSFSSQNFIDTHSRNHSFDYYSALSFTSFTLTGDQQPEAVNGVLASSDFGRVMGVAPAFGRWFTADEDAPDKEHVALISDGLWKRRFGTDPQIVGKSIQLNGEPYTIIGVMPANFNFPNPNYEVWAPLALDSSKYDRTHGFLQGVARLKPNVTIEQARADLQSIEEQIKRDNPSWGRGLAVKVLPLREYRFGDLDRPLLILLGAVALVLLVACVNVANLMFGRATAKWKEMAVRSALGASRWSLVRMLLVESAMLGAVSGALGLLLANYGIDALVAISPSALPTPEKITIDAYVIAFTFLISLLTVVLFGLAPALQVTKTDLTQALRESSRSATGARRLKLMRGALVVGEICLSLVLLASAGLLLESLWRLLSVSPGFKAEHVVTCRIDLPATKYPGDKAQADFFRGVLKEAHAIPGIENASLITSLPFSGSRGTSSFSIDGRPDEPGNEPSADRHQVAPGYFAAMGIALLAGRDFTDADDMDHAGVVIVNEAAAKRFWPDENPLGKRITIGMGQEVKLYGKPVSREIVGVVGNVKHEQLKDDFQPEMYIPAWHLPTPNMMLIVRGNAPPESLINSMRQAVQSIDHDQPIRRAQTLQAAIARTVAPLRFVTALLALFAGLALTLAIIGIYGVMSYAVAQRTQEIGIRMALGAQYHDVLKLVMGHGVILTLAGIGLGLACALVLTRVMASLLFEVKPTDVTTFAVVSISQAIIAMVACYVPARRATKVDPLVALRYE